MADFETMRAELLKDLAAIEERGKNLGPWYVYSDVDIERLEIEATILESHGRSAHRIRALIRSWLEEMGHA